MLTLCPLLHGGEIHNAAASGNVVALEKILTANPGAVDSKVQWKDEIEGWTIEGTALHLAVLRGHKDAVKLILTKGANVNARDESACTPLHLAAARAKMEIVEILLQTRGIDVNAVDANKKTPLHMAVVGLSFGLPPEDAQKLAVVELLLRRGANPNAKDGNGATPLQEATYWKLSAIAELLRKYGAK